jgi:hypothetical protein
MSGIIHNVPAHLESRIRQLCIEALAAKTQVELDDINAELRSAIQEYIRLAKELLRA